MANGKEWKTEEVKENERKMIIKEFYDRYNRLRKRYSLRMHSHFSIYDDGLIEIWQYADDRKTRLICKIKEEDDVDCYKKAIEALKKFEEDRSKS